MEKKEELLSKLKSYKKKSYKRKLFSRLAISIGFLIGLFILISFLEYNLWLESSSRFILFLVFIISLLFSFWYLSDPIFKLLNLKKGITNEEAAKTIGSFFPSIQDKILNTLQLISKNEGSNDLLNAAIRQKSVSFDTISFSSVINFKELKKYVIFLSCILFIFLLSLIIKPKTFSESANRIIKFNQEFEKPSPFKFEFSKNSTNAFLGEDFEIKFKILGKMLPKDVFLVINNQKIRLKINRDGNYEHLLKSVQKNFTYYVEASGFKSKEFDVKIANRPDLIEMDITIKNPAHTGGEIHFVKNTGNLTVLEGSLVNWKLKTQNTESLNFTISDKKVKVFKHEKEAYFIKKQIFRNASYKIKLDNEFSENLSKLNYKINVIKDEFPKIEANVHPDTVNFNWLIISGDITDDYGFSSLKLFYKSKSDKKYQSFSINISNKTNSQSFFETINLDSLKIRSEKSLEFFVAVRDNDKINGYKQSKTRVYELRKPKKNEIEKIASQRSKNIQKGLEKNKEDAKDLSNQLEKIKNRIRTKQKIDWQEKKMIKDVIKSRENLEKKLDELENKHKQLENTNKKLNLKNKNISEKSKKLQELINKLKDEETMKLYEELKKELEKNNTDSTQEKIDKISKKEKNLERELERTLELFKRLKMESELAKNMNQLNELAKKQEELSNENADDEIQEQEEINKTFEKFQKSMKEVRQMNKELDKPNSMTDFSLEEKLIQRETEKAKKELEEENSKEKDKNEDKRKSGNQSNKSQKNAAQKMRNLAQKMSKMQGGMEMEMMQANMEQLRGILDNLLTLSFDQEKTMKEMRSVNQSDPRYLEISQNQLKIKDDVKVIEDSLISLSKNMAQLSTFVTREVNKINDHIDKSVLMIKARENNKATADQQFAMTSINNLALMLSDVMNQMQMQMSEAMGKGKKKGKKKSSLTKLGEMQKQLGEKMKQVKKSGKKGKELSKDLAEMAAEQERIRRELEKIKEGIDGKPAGTEISNKLKDAINQMKKTEIDIVNKQLTNQLIQRQKQITTKMLEAENATKDQNKDKERESNTAKEFTKSIPPNLEKYFKQKKNQTEFFKTIPLELNPFYKKEAKEYFKRLNNR